VGGEKAKPPFGGEHPDLHVPPLPQGKEALGEALEEGLPVWGLGEGLEGLGDQALAPGEGFGAAVGPPQAFPHLVGQQGGEEEEGQGHRVKPREEEEDQGGEEGGQKPPGEAVDAGQHGHGDHEPGEDVGVAVAQKPHQKPHQEGGQGYGRIRQGHVWPMLNARTSVSQQGVSKSGLKAFLGPPPRLLLRWGT
jgi:hypothetical protein